MSKRIITLGKWENKPIEWIVLKEESFGALVISKFLLFSRCFSHNDNRWQSSEIRQYLNNEFFNEAFNEIEKRKIINTEILTDSNKSKDDIFLLSSQEANELLTVEERKFGNGSCGISCSFNNCGKCYKCNANGYSGCWLLRSVYSNSEVYRCCIGGGLYSISISQTHGIRPAMYIKE